MLTKKEKSTVITKYAATQKDTGSPTVQVALLTHQIDKLTGHLKAHQKDNHSRRGLIKIVGKRRRLINYLAKSNPKSYQDLVKQLNIGKASDNL